MDSDKKDKTPVPAEPNPTKPDSQSKAAQGSVTPAVDPDKTAPTPVPVVPSAAKPDAPTEVVPVASASDKTDKSPAPTASVKSAVDPDKTTPTPATAVPSAAKPDAPTEVVPVASASDKSDKSPATTGNVTPAVDPDKTAPTPATAVPSTAKPDAPTEVVPVASASEKTDKAAPTPATAVPSAAKPDAPTEVVPVASASEKIDMTTTLTGDTGDPDKTDRFPVREIEIAAAAAAAAAAEVHKVVTQEVGWVTDKGLVRSNNEDSLAAVTLNEATNDAMQSVGLYAVADGMGGHEAGEVASRIAVRTVIRKLMEEVTVGDDSVPEHYQQWLKSAVALANQIIYNKANEANKSMGTTLVMAIVVGHKLHIVNVGDSRAYIISPSSIRQVTHDHSFVQALVDSGAISQKEANEHPRRNILTQSVGAQEDVSIDLYNETLGSDEWLLLCSDGLWDMLSNEVIGRIVRSAKTPGEAAQALVDATNAAGGHDNVAAVLVRLGTPPQKAEKDIEKDDDDTLILPTQAATSS